MGRAAMLGVAFAIVGEILTGSGPLAQLGYEVREELTSSQLLLGGYAAVWRAARIACNTCAITHPQ